MLNDMEKRALIVSLVEKMKNGGSWCGETHIQKCVYFLQQLLLVPMDYKYIMYKHGPYSFDLSDELAFLRGNAFLELRPRLPYGPSLFPGKYDKILKDKYAAVIFQYTREVDFVVKKLADKTVKELEKISTTLYVKKEKQWVSEKDIVDQIMQLKPHIKRKDVDEALDYLKIIEKAAVETFSLA